MQYIIFLLLAPVAAIICGVVFFLIGRYSCVSSCARSTAVALRWYLAVIIGFLFTNTLELLAPTPASTLLLAKFDYLFIAFTPVAWFAFALAYTGRERLLTIPHFWPFCISPLITNLLVWTNDLHGLVWQHYSFKLAGQFLSMSVASYGGWFWVHTIYSYGLFLLGAAFITFAYLRSHHLYRRQSTWVMAGALTPLLGNIVYIFHLVPGLQKDFSPVTFALAGLAFAVGINRYRLLDLMPIARAALVEELPDGVIVVDQGNRVVDINPAGRQILHLPEKDGLGQMACSLLPFWPKATDHLLEDGVNASEITLEEGGNKLFFDLHISALSENSGWLVTLRDITLHKQTEEALQQAQRVLEQRIQERTAELRALNATLEQRIAGRTRDLSALYAVSSVASEAHDLDSLLSESLTRTVSSLQSDAGAVYLIEEAGERQVSNHLRLAVHQAASSAALAQLQTQIEKQHRADWVIENGEPMLIPGSQDGETPTTDLPSEQPFTLLIVPMRTEGKVVGLMSLSRFANPLFNLEEVALLSAIADQVGVAVAGYRLRQMAHQAQVLAQRQKLAADLHDSVTQSLYGLVAFSEAGLAQIERADLPALKKTIERISGETRQALKEMRLFLHELRPLVLESEGLVGALHQRMAAVEGRSDVHARLLADETINLPFEIEETLFRISQEALNNILRHAHAANVTVFLGREKDLVLLEVIDDGCGFDAQAVSAGRMGLENMRARAAAVGGEFRIHSVPGHGTRLKVSVPIDRQHSNFNDQSQVSAAFLQNGGKNEHSNFDRR